MRRLWRALEARPAAALLVLGAASLTLQILGFHDLRHDDAYITYRYGHNLAAGEGLVFNPGERVMGSTSPGQALLAALLSPLLGPALLPTAMAVLGCLAWTAQAGAVFFLLRRAVAAIPALLVALCFAAGCAGSAQWVALETNLAVALALWALVAALAGRWLAAAAICAAAGLVRPDAYLVAAILFALGARELGRGVWRPAALFFALALPWPVFSAAYFGSPLPASAAAKLHETGAADYAIHIARHASARLADDAAPVTSWLAFFLGAFLLVRRAPRLWILPAYAILHFAAYAALRPATYYTWHLYPGAAAFTAVGLGGVAALGHLGSRRLITVGIPLVLAAMLAFYGARTASLAASHGGDYWFGARDAVYREIASELRARAGPGERVVAVEIGTLAYFSDRPMHDLAGLVTTERRRLPEDTRWLVVASHAAMRVKGAAVATVRVGRFEARLYPLPPEEHAALERVIADVLR